MFVIVHCVVIMLMMMLQGVEAVGAERPFENLAPVLLGQPVEVRERRPMRVACYGRGSARRSHLRQWRQRNLVVALQTHAAAVGFEVVRFAFPPAKTLRGKNHIVTLNNYPLPPPVSPLTISFCGRCFESVRWGASRGTDSRTHCWWRTMSRRNLCSAVSSVHGNGTESQKVSSMKMEIKSERSAWIIWLAFTARKLGQRVYIKSTVGDGSER